MLKDTQIPRYSVRRTHRSYTPQFKAELVAACQQPGASIAALALQHGMNANVLHRWLKEHRRHGCHPLQVPDFIPIELARPQPCSAATPEPSAAPADIRIECQRAGMTVSVHWPISAAAQCAQMLREWLR